MFSILFSESGADTLPRAVVAMHLRHWRRAFHFCSRPQRIQVVRPLANSLLYSRPYDTRRLRRRIRVLVTLIVAWAVMTPPMCLSTVRKHAWAAPPAGSVRALALPSLLDESGEKDAVSVTDTRRDAPVSGSAATPNQARLEGNQRSNARPPTMRLAPSSPATSIDIYEDHRGIVLVPEDQQDELGYSLIVNGRFQTRYTSFRDHGPFANPGANEFEMERVRLGFRGFVFAPYMQYNIGTDWDSDGAGGTAHDGGLLHAFVQFRLEKAVGLGWGNRTSLRLGIWRTNFGRQVTESSKRLQFVDRSLTSSVFNLGTNAGLALLGEFVHDYRPVRYELALLNGFGTASNSPRANLDTNLGVALRATETLIGDYHPGEGDNALSEFPSLRVGCSFAYTHRTRRGKDGAASEFDNPPAILLATDVPGGIPFFAMDQLRGAEREYDLWVWGVEADWKRCGWSLHTEYLFRSIDSVRFASDHDFRDFTHGFYVQGGYFVTEKVELVARHSEVYANGGGTGSPIGADYNTSASATGGGVNFYFREHYAKFQIDAFYYNGAPITASSLNVIGGDQGIMLRAQYQLAF